MYTHPTEESQEYSELSSPSLQEISSLTQPDEGSHQSLVQAFLSQQHFAARTQPTSVNISTRITIVAGNMGMNTSLFSITRI